MSQLFYLPFLPVPTQTGLPAGGAKAYFFLSGTTTFAAIYADAALTTPMDNPVAANALGRLPNIYLPDNQVLRVRIVDAFGGTIGADIDPYVPGAAVTIVPSLPQLLAPDGATKVGYGRSNIALPVSDSMPRTLAYMGVPNSTGDVSTRLFQALADANGDAKITGLVADAWATYRKDGQMLLTKSLDGQGATFVALSDGTNDIRVSGDRQRVANLRHLGAGTTRGNGANELNGLTGFNATRLLIDNVEIGSVDEAGDKGFPAAGMLFVACEDVVLRRPIVRYTKADGIHTAVRSKHVRIFSPFVYRSGDDGIAVVSYVPDGDLTEDVQVFGARVVEPKGRGVSVVGGRNCFAWSPIVDRSSAAAFYLASEDSYNTYGVTNCAVLEGTAIGCVTGNGLDSNFSQAACFILGRGGTGTISGVTVDFANRDSLIQAEIIGLGARANCSGFHSSPYNIRPQLDLRLMNTTGTAFFPVGVKAGGVNGRTRVAGENNGGHLLDFVSGNALRIHRLELMGFDGIRTQNDPTNCTIYTEGDNNIQALYITGEAYNAPSTAIIDGAGFGAKIRKRDFWYNGAEVTS